MRRSNPSQKIPNKDLKKTLGGMSFWLKKFNLDLKPFETLFKRPEKPKILFFVTLALLVSAIVSIGASIWTRKRELSKPKIAELIAVISELSITLRHP